MRETIIAIIRKIAGAEAPVELSVPESEGFGHCSTNLAMRLAKEKGVKPLDLAKELAEKIANTAPRGFFEKVEAAAPGFINFWLSQETIQGAFVEIAKEKSFGKNGTMKGKTVMVEFTDPNPFKLFHIGHLMSNTIGESFARLYEAAGAKVIRANYQGDVGLHVAKAIFGMEHMKDDAPKDGDALLAKMEFLGKAYALGASMYEKEPGAKDAIAKINEKVYSRDDKRVNELYDKGRKWSLDYFETVYKRLGTKFDNYFFEGEMAKDGLAFIGKHRDIFVESEGAIVFPGEKYGLHTRVFVSSQGLPTYEAKELGLNKKKFELYPLDLSIIVTGNEIVDYFRVLLKAMELVLPDVAAKTKHVPHGMLRLPTGKMSSRTGDVVSAESLLDQVKAKLASRVSEKSDLPEEDRAAVTEAIAVGAIKYSILKQNPGQDIIFDFEKSLSFEGDSGPYVQYAYARLKSILRKAEKRGKGDVAKLDTPIELSLMRKIFELPDAVLRAKEKYASSGIVSYAYDLAATANKFYETTPILKDEDASRRDARLGLIETTASTLHSALSLLGIATLEKI